MKLAFFDLEGTLISLGNWNKVASFFSEEWYSNFLEKYEEGKISYEEGREEMSKIGREKKLTKKQIIEVLKGYEVFEGARDLIDGLKKKGYTVIIVTGAISVLAEMVKEDLGIDEVHSAHNFIFDDKGCFLDIEDNEGYGRGKGKVDIMNEIMEREKVSLKDCIAIGGDDINDYWMMKEFRSFSVNPPLNRIKEVVDHEVNNLKEILEFV